MKSARRIVWIVFALAIVVGIGFLLRPVSYFNGAMYVHEALTGVRSKYVSVNGCRIHYLVEGSENSKPVVLVHGLGSRAEDWRNLAPALVDAGYRVYIPDLPGFGRSERPANFSYSVRDDAHIVIAFMDAMHLDHIDLGGWSMGGWIVQIVAGEAPGRINRLMLFDSAGLHIEPEWDTRLFTPADAAQLNQFDGLLMPAPPKVPSFVARDILRVSHEDAWIIQRAMASMLTGQDATDSLLPTLQMPVLIVWGDKDQITPFTQGQAMLKLLPHAELAPVAGCGHLAPVQCSSQIAPRMLEFLAQKP